MLAAAHRQGAQAGTPVRLRAVSSRIRHLLGLLGLDAVLSIEPEPGGDRDPNGPQVRADDRPRDPARD